MWDAPVFSHCSSPRNPWPQSAGVLEHFREEETNCWFCIFHGVSFCASLRRGRISMYPSLFRVLPSGMNSQWTMGVKSFQRDLSFPVSTRNFCIELMMMVSTAFFFCRSYKKRHVSSPVIMFLRDFLCLPDLPIMSPEILFRISFIFGRQHSICELLTKAAHVQHVIKNAVTTSYRNTILWSSSVYRFPSVCPYNLSHTIDICSIFNVGRQLLRVLSSRLTRLSWKRICQSFIWDFFFTVSPYACCNMVNNSAGDFCSNTQNIILVHCSITDIFYCDWRHAHWGNKQLLLWL